MHLEKWDERGLALDRRANTAQMKVHLGGAEPDERVVRRHERILAGLPGAMFLVMVPDSPDPVGSVGYWEREWRGEAVWEMGWQILPEFQGRGLAVAATVAALEHAAAATAAVSERAAAVSERAAAATVRRHVHAYPSVTNAGSNAVCRKAGFDLLGEVNFEFPPGNPLRCNDWRYDLVRGQAPA